MHSQSRETDASPAAVWAIWSNPKTWPEWNPDVKAISLSSIVSGAAGTMETKAGGKHDITIDSVTPGRSFELVSTGIPGHRLAFRCEVEAQGVGSRISQGVTIRGPLAPLFNAVMGKKIAESFGPLLQGLKERVEGHAS